MKNEYQTEEYIVVFIDILGVTNKIYKDRDELLNVVHNAYDQTMKAIDKLFANEIAITLKPKVKNFSDNIAICILAKTKEKYKAFVAAALCSAYIQNQFLYSGYVLRGGIALGDCYIDETMVWEKALIDAYTAESSIAIYPRIVIYPETVGKLKLALDKRKRSWILQDVDELFSLTICKKKF